MEIKMDKILWNVWLQGIYRESGKPHLAVTRADSDERYMRLLGQVTTDPNDYRDRCKITDPPEVMMFHMIGAAWAAAYDKWLASGGDRIAKQAVIDTLKKNNPNAYELRLADKLEKELAATGHVFADSNMGSAIANAPAAAKYRLTNDPDMGCLLIMESPETDKQPWVLRMPIKDWAPFLDAMAVAGKTLVPDRDPDDEHDVTPVW